MAGQELDYIDAYARSAGLVVKPRTVFVEGTSDVQYFKIAADLEAASGGPSLLDESFCITAAGERDQGGVDGVVQQVMTFMKLGRTLLDRDGRAVYRFLGLFDNDFAGRRALKLTTTLNLGIQEFKDVFCLYPLMNPAVGDPAAVGRAIRNANVGFSAIDWEIEDMLDPNFLDVFEQSNPSAVKSKVESPGKHIHREYTVEGKAALLRFTRENAIRSDVDRIVAALIGLRSYIRV